MVEGVFIERLDFENNRFYGIFHKAINTIDKKRVVIVIGGSEGNENIPMNVGKMFVNRGIDALGVRL